VITGSAGLVTVGVLRVGYVTPAQFAVAAVATAVYLPVHLWHTYQAAQGTRPRGTAWSLAAMAVVIGGVLPVVGVQWLGALYPLAASALLVLRPPWSFAAFAGLIAVPAPLAFAFGEPSWAAYFTVGLALNGLVLAVPVWLIAAVRDLRSARERLAAAIETGASPLTQRETDVLRAAESGISTEAIGAQLSLSPATVRNYLSNAIGR